METLCERKRIYQLDPPAETIDGINDDMDKGRAKFGQYFKNNEEFEFFWMLPLDDRQKATLIYELHKEKKTQMEIKSCGGVMDSDPFHRARCIECCTVQRPKCAKSYY